MRERWGLKRGRGRPQGGRGGRRAERRAKRRERRPQAEATHRSRALRATRPKRSPPPARRTRERSDQPAESPQRVSRKISPAKRDTALPCPRPPRRGRGLCRGVEEEGRGPPDDGVFGAGAPKRRRGLRHGPEGDEPAALRVLKRAAARKDKDPTEDGIARQRGHNPTEHQRGVGEMCFPTTLRQPTKEQKPKAIPLSP